MPTIQQQTPDGGWEPAVPLGPQTNLARLEAWFRQRGHERIARVLGRLDEIGL